MFEATGTTRTDESDIAYLKRMASAGHGEPAPFLILMAVFGGAYGLAFTALCLLVGGPDGMRLGAGSGFLAQVLRWSFIAAHVAFVAALIWTGWRTFGPDRIRLSRSATATWSAAFIGLVTTVVGFWIYGDGQLPSDSRYVAYMLPPVLLVLWGSAWWITAILHDRCWLMLVAGGSFSAAVALAIAGNSAAMLPVIAASLLLLAFVPAVLLMRSQTR